MNPYLTPNPRWAVRCPSQLSHAIMNDRQEYAREYRRLTSTINRLKRFLETIENQTPYRVPHAEHVKQLADALKDVHDTIRKSWDNYAP